MKAQVLHHSFVPTDGTLRALEVCSAFLTQGSGATRLLLLHGPPGVGKTHLLRCLAHRAGPGRPGALVQTTAEDLIQSMIDATRGAPGGNPWRQCTSAEIVLIDDLHVLAEKPRTQQEIALLLKAAVDDGARVVCTVGRPAEVPAFVDAIRVFPGVRIVDLRPPNAADTRRILAARAKAEAVGIDPRRLASIAARSRGDVRRAVGALTRHRFEQAGRVNA